MKGKLAVRGRCVVTGGSGGIGYATARLLATGGSEVAVLDMSAPPGWPAQNVERGRIVWYETDVSSEESAQVGVERAVAALGGIDGLVCAAGVHRLLPFDGISAGEWGAMLGINLMGVVNVVRATLPAMRRAEADRSIVVVASLSGVRGHPITSDGSGGSHYAASKAAVIGLAKSLALELGREGIRVNAVAPAMTDTALIQHSYSGDARAEYASRVPLRQRLASVEDVANYITYLLSDLSSYVTGQAVIVSGGMDLV